MFLHLQRCQHVWTNIKAKSKQWGGTAYNNLSMQIKGPKTTTLTIIPHLISFCYYKLWQTSWINTFQLCAVHWCPLTGSPGSDVCSSHCWSVKSSIVAVNSFCVVVLVRWRYLERVQVPSPWVSTWWPRAASLCLNKLCCRVCPSPSLWRPGEDLWAEGRHRPLVCYWSITASG